VEGSDLYLPLWETDVMLCVYVYLPTVGLAELVVEGSQSPTPAPTGGTAYPVQPGDHTFKQFTEIQFLYCIPLVTKILYSFGISQLLQLNFHPHYQIGRELRNKFTDGITSFEFRQ
jgi:hypothetical protein